MINYFLAGKDLQQNNQLNDQAGVNHNLQTSGLVCSKLQQGEQAAGIFSCSYRRVPVLHGKHQPQSLLQVAACTCTLTLTAVAMQECAAYHNKSPFSRIQHLVNFSSCHITLRLR